MFEIMIVKTMQLLRVIKSALRPWERIDKAEVMNEDQKSRDPSSRVLDELEDNEITTA